MIFLLRILIFSALILLGFHISTRSITGRRVVLIVYGFTLIWYCFLCRLPLFTSVPVAADNTATVVTTTSPSTLQTVVNAKEFLNGFNGYLMTDEYTGRPENGVNFY